MNQMIVDITIYALSSRRFLLDEIILIKGDPEADLCIRKDHPTLYH